MPDMHKDPNMAAHTWKTEAGGLPNFKASLVHIESSRTAEREPRVVLSNCPSSSQPCVSGMRLWEPLEVYLDTRDSCFQETFSEQAGSRKGNQKVQAPAWVCLLIKASLSLSLSSPQAAEKGHKDICSLLLQHSPALKAVRDRKARLACDLLPCNSGLWDLLAS